MKSFAFECYQGLMKKRHDYVGLLQQYQQQIQHDEHALVLIKQYLDNYYEKKYTFDTMVNQLIVRKEWITAEKHRQIYDYDEKLTQEYMAIISRKRKRIDMMDLKVKEAESVARHLLGIESGLKSLKNYLKTLSE